jgi:hypothetical protein
VEAITRQKLALGAIAITAVVLASGAVLLAVRLGDPISPLFREALTLQIVAVLIVWFTVAWAARRVIVGQLPTDSIPSPAALLWGGSRVALVGAIFLVLVACLVSLTLGFQLASAFARALFFLFVAMAATGIAGGAAINSILAWRHWRVRQP